MRTKYQKSDLFKSLGALVILPLFVSCLETGGDGSVNMGSSPTGVSGGIAISILKIQNSVSTAWITDVDGKVYLKNSTVSLQGECTRGVATISATVNGTPVTESAPCKKDGTFLWEKSFSGVTPALGTQYDIILQAMSADSNLITGITASKTIIVDLNAPTPPVFDPVAGCTLSVGTWLCSSPYIQVTGTWSSAEDVTSPQMPANGTATFPTSNTFAFNFTLSEGQSRNLDFAVRDRAGNLSGLATITVVFSPSTNVLASSVNAGGTLGFSGGPINTAASMIGNIGTISGQFYDLNSPAPQNQKAQLQIGPIAIGVQQINP